MSDPHLEAIRTLNIKLSSLIKYKATIERGLRSTNQQIQGLQLAIATLEAQASTDSKAASLEPGQPEDHPEQKR